MKGKFDQMFSHCGLISSEGRLEIELTPRDLCQAGGRHVTGYEDSTFGGFALLSRLRCTCIVASVAVAEAHPKTPTVRVD